MILFTFTVIRATLLTACRVTHVLRFIRCCIKAWRTFCLVDMGMLVGWMGFAQNELATYLLYLLSTDTLVYS